MTNCLLRGPPLVTIMTGKGSKSPMKKKKQIRGAPIREKILSLLEEHTKPISTRELAQKTGHSWHTIMTHCLRLQLDKKIEGYKISNINVWEEKKRK